MRHDNHCGTCGKENDTDAAYCEACGSPLLKRHASAPVPPRKERRYRWLLALGGGLLGLFLANLIFRIIPFVSSRMADRAARTVAGDMSPRRLEGTPSTSGGASSSEEYSTQQAGLRNFAAGPAESYSDARAVKIADETLVDAHGAYGYFTPDGNGIVYTKVAGEFPHAASLATIILSNKDGALSKAQGQIVHRDSAGQTQVLASGINGVLSPDMRRLAFLRAPGPGSLSVDLCIMDMATREIRTVPGVLHPDVFDSAIRWSRHKNALYFVGPTNIGRTLDLDSLKLYERVTAEEDEDVLRYPGQGKSRLFSSGDKVAFYFDGYQKTGIHARNKKGNEDVLLIQTPRPWLELSPDGKVLLSGGNDGIHFLRLSSIGSARPQWKIDLGSKHLSGMFNNVESQYRWRELQPYLNGRASIIAAVYSPSVNPLSGVTIGPGRKKGLVKLTRIDDLTSAVEEFQLESMQRVATGDVVNALHAEAYEGKLGFDIDQRNPWYVLHDPSHEPEAQVRLKPGIYPQSGKVVRHDYFGVVTEFEISSIDVREDTIGVNFVVRNLSRKEARFLVGNNIPHQELGQSVGYEKPYLVDGLGVKHFAADPVVQGEIGRFRFEDRARLGGKSMEKFRLPPNSSAHGSMRFENSLNGSGDIDFEIPGNGWQSFERIRGLQVSVAR